MEVTYILIRVRNTHLLLKDEVWLHKHPQLSLVQSPVGLGEGCNGGLSANLYRLCCRPHRCLHRIAVIDNR